MKLLAITIISVLILLVLLAIGEDIQSKEEQKNEEERLRQKWL
jgi:hypothetical protein